MTRLRPRLVARCLSVSRRRITIQMVPRGVSSNIRAALVYAKYSNYQYKIYPIPMHESPEVVITTRDLQRSPSAPVLNSARTERLYGASGANLHLDPAGVPRGGYSACRFLIR